MSEDRRPKRRCVTRKTAMPSAVHYVGYVEEDETPEMIMKKFEALEKVMQASTKPSELPPTAIADDKENHDAGVEAAAAGTSKPGEHQPADIALDDTQLMEVFKQTSIFNVKSAMANNTVLMAAERSNQNPMGNGNDDDGMLSSEEENEWNYLKGFWADDEFFNDKSRGKRGKRGSRLKTSKRSEKCHQLITQYNKDTNALIRRKVRVVDPDAILQVRIPPPPVPLSWARSVKPYVPKHARQAAALALAAAPELTVRSSTFQAPDLCSFDFKQLPASSYMAVLINTGWERPAPGSDPAADQPAAGTTTSTSASSFLSLMAVVERLRKIPLQQLCPVGFVFVWAEKHHIHGVCKALHTAGYYYVENLTWVLMAANNSILRLEHPYTCKSHLTLLIFRKEGEGKDIELRHQRSPDVIFEGVTSAEGRDWSVPEQALSTIETMLPGGKGAFLELWAPAGAARPGWTHVAEVAGEAPATVAQVAGEVQVAAS